jgi:flagellar protein FlbD
MIRLTRLTGEPFVLNADLIRFVERRPDTFITLTTDERVIVRESVEEVVERSIDYARTIRFVPGLARAS